MSLKFCSVVKCYIKDDHWCLLFLQWLLMLLMCSHCCDSLFLCSVCFNFVNTALSCMHAAVWTSEIL